MTFTVEGSVLHITLRLVGSFLETGGTAHYPTSGQIKEHVGPHGAGTGTNA